MKIGMVCYPTYGGSGVVATELGKCLALRGHRVHFVTHAQPVRLSLLTDRIHFHKVTVPDYPLFNYPSYELTLSSKLVEVVEREKLELLHVHYAIPHAYAAYMAQRMLGERGVYIPLVTTLHGTDITAVGHQPSYKPAVAFGINQSDAVTAVSRSLRAETYECFDVRKDIQVIYNFVDLDGTVFDPMHCKRRALAGAHQRIVTHVSNFRPVKRIRDVIDIFYGIQKEIPAVLLMVGEGPEKRLAEDRVKELGLAKQVKFLGNCLEIGAVLRHSDLFLLPAEKESFGLAALEAMAFGTPVISSDAGGLGEVNRNGFSGFLSPVGAVAQMVRHGISILRDDAILERFKNQARQVAAAFNRDEIVTQYESVYAAVVRDRAAVK